MNIGKYVFAQVMVFFPRWILTKFMKNFVYHFGISVVVDSSSLYQRASPPNKSKIRDYVHELKTDEMAGVVSGQIKQLSHQ